MASLSPELNDRVVSFRRAMHAEPELSPQFFGSWRFAKTGNYQYGRKME